MRAEKRPKIRFSNIDHFDYAYRFGNYHAAGKAADCSASTVQAGVRALAEDLGCLLFTWDGKKLVPTPDADEYYLKYVRPFLEGSVSLQQRAKQKSVPTRCIVGTHHTIQTYLEPRCRVFLEDFPDLCVVFQAVNRADAEQYVRDGRADLAILTTDAAPEGLSWEVLATVPAVFVVRDDSGITDVDTLLRRGLHPQHLLCPPAAEGVCRRVQPLLDTRGAKFAARTELTATSYVPWQVASTPNTIGLSVGVESLAKAGTRMLPIPVAHLMVGVAWRGPASPRLRRILAALAKAAECVK